MRWTAIVPIKATADSKSRLAASLTLLQRTALSTAMANHVLSQLHAAPSVRQIVVVAPTPWPSAQWIADLGRGLNRELDSARAEISGSPILVVHADLPWLEVADVERMLASASVAGAAIAPDRRCLGTNAIALADARLPKFAFGPASFERHRASLGLPIGIVSSPGLARDVDELEDLAGLSKQF